jgi:hypothetical protein
MFASTLTKSKSKSISLSGWEIRRTHKNSLASVQVTQLATETTMSYAINQLKLTSIYFTQSGGRGRTEEGRRVAGNT